MEQGSISFAETRELFKMNSLRPLNDFASHNKIKVTASNVDGKMQLFFDRYELCRILKIEKIPKKFLTVKEAAKKLGLSEGYVSALCKRGDLPHYRLKNNRGSKLFFLESEILASKKTVVEKDLNFYMRSRRYELYQDFFAKNLTSITQSGFISDKKLEIINDVLIKGLSLLDLKDKYKLPSDRIITIVKDGLSLLGEYVDHLNEERSQNQLAVKSLQEDNRNLMAENAVLRQKIRDLKFQNDEELLIDDNFSVSLEKFKFSVRVNNCLNSAGIKTLGELLNCRCEDLIALRHFGESCLKEVSCKLAKRQLKLKR